MFEISAAADAIATARFRLSQKQPKQCLFTVCQRSSCVLSSPPSCPPLNRHIDIYYYFNSHPRKRRGSGLGAHITAAEPHAKARIKRVSALFQTLTDKVRGKVLRETKVLSRLLYDDFLGKRSFFKGRRLFPSELARRLFL